MADSCPVLQLPQLLRTTALVLSSSSSSFTTYNDGRRRLVAFVVPVSGDARQ